MLPGLCRSSWAARRMLCSALSDGDAREKFVRLFVVANGQLRGMMPVFLCCRPTRALQRPSRRTHRLAWRTILYMASDADGCYSDATDAQLESGPLVGFFFYFPFTLYFSNILFNLDIVLIFANKFKSG